MRHASDVVFMSSRYVRILVSRLAKRLISFLFLYRRITQRKFLFEIAWKEMVSTGRSGTCIFFSPRGMCGYLARVPYFHDSKSEIFRNVVSYVEG